MNPATGAVAGRLKEIQNRAVILPNAIRQAAASEKGVRAVELETLLRESVPWLEAHRSELSPHDYAYTRGLLANSYGTILLETEKYPLAEVALREAIQFRREAQAKGANPIATRERAWETTESQTKMCTLLTKLGRMPNRCSERPSN